MQINKQTKKSKQNINQKTSKQKINRRTSKQKNHILRKKNTKQEIKQTKKLSKE